MKKIDPTERALDAYFQLDTDQRKTFHATVFHVEKERDRILGATPNAAAPKPLGRPKGSKNRRVVIETNEGSDVAERMFKAAPTAQELDLRHNNGAATEGL